MCRTDGILAALDLECLPMGEGGLAIRASGAEVRIPGPGLPSPPEEKVTAPVTL